MKVLTVVGTRPEVIKLSMVIKKLDSFTDHILVHTGQNYDYTLNKIFFDEMGIRLPNYNLRCGGSSIETVSFVLGEINRILEDEKPDAFLILGDTNSCLSAYAAKRRHIPVFHMEAGNRCFDDRTPEEVNRRIIDHISDINMPYTDIARTNLIAEGLRLDRVFKIGSPLREVLTNYRSQIDDSTILDKLRLVNDKYLLVSFHREENMGRASKFIQLLNELSTKFPDFPVIVSTHPRLRNVINYNIALFRTRAILFKEPFGFFDYVKLEKNAYAVLSDSGTLTEESYMMNFPALNLRESYERQEGMQAGIAPLVSLDIDGVLENLTFIRQRVRFSMINSYDIEDVSDKVVNIILSSVDTIKKLYI